MLITQIFVLSGNRTHDLQYKNQGQGFMITIELGTIHMVLYIVENSTKPCVTLWFTKEVTNTKNQTKITAKQIGYIFIKSLPKK